MKVTLARAEKKLSRPAVAPYVRVAVACVYQLYESVTHRTLRIAVYRYVCVLSALHRNGDLDAGVNRGFVALTGFGTARRPRWQILCREP